MRLCTKEATKYRRVAETTRSSDDRTLEERVVSLKGSMLRRDRYVPSDTWEKRTVDEEESGGFLEVDADREGGVERAWLSEWEREGQQCGDDEHARWSRGPWREYSVLRWVESSGRHGFGGVECGQEQDWVSDLCPVTVPCYSQGFDPDCHPCRTARHVFSKPSTENRVLRQNFAANLAQGRVQDQPRTDSELPSQK